MAACGLTESGSLQTEQPDTGTPDVVVKDVVVIDEGIDSPPPCVSASCQDGKLCKAGVCDYFASCAEIHASDPTLTSNVYTVFSPKKKAPVLVYCEMAEAGGGWTLIARPVVGAPPRV